MNDITALASKLASLIAEDSVFANGARVISQAGAPPAMTAILREVDDTVLERVLVFSIGDTHVEMAVSGRRLRGLLDISGDLPGMEDVVGEVLSTEEPETLGACGAILAHLCSADPRVTVRSTPARAIGAGSDKGVSVSQLATHWKVDLLAKGAPPIQRFLAANEDAISAHMYVESGGVPQTNGDVTALGPIWEEQVASLRTHHKEVRVKQDGPTLFCFEGAVGGIGAAALAVAGDDICIFAYDPAQIGGIIASWNAISG